ncbi:MAG: hypothetical protein AB7V47_10650 [Phycisphaerales bacterium]
MNFAVATLIPPLFAAQPSHGLSAEAQHIGAALRDRHAHLERAETFGFARVDCELDEIGKACAVRGWDGYGAAPISLRVHEWARRFVRGLPLGTRTPSIAPESDGQIAFEWHKKPRWTLSVSVTAEGMLHYSAVLGSSSIFGTTRLTDTVPRDIIDLIERVQRA